MIHKPIPETPCVKNLAVRNVFVFPKSAGTNSPYDGYSPSPRLSGRFNRKLSSTEAGADRDYQIDRQESSEFHQRDFSSETEVPKDDLSRDYQWNFSSTETETERVGDDYQIKIKNPGRNIPIRIKTPRIRNPADGIKIRNPGKNINVRIRTPIFKNPASGVKINIGRFNRKLSSTEAVGRDRDYQINRQESSRFHQQDLSSETEVPKDDLTRDYQWKLSSTETEGVGDDYQINRQGRGRGFCVGQGCLGNPGAGLGIKNPGRNIPIRIKTPRIRNPADGIKIRNPGKNINVRIRTPIFKNPASGVKINIGRFNRKLSSTEAVGVGRDYQINSRFHQRELSSEREVPKNDLSQDYDLTSEPEPATNYLDRDYQQDLPEKNLVKKAPGKDYQSITYHPGAHQLPLSVGSPYSGYKQSRRLSQPRWPTAS